MGKLIPNDYRLDNLNTRISPENIRKALSDPEFFLANYQQIINKQRQTVPFKLNAFQKMLFSLVVPKIASATRLNRRHNLVICKGRQQGASVSIVALINYICAFLDNTNNLVCLHTFPVGQTISKFYARKVQPIISGCLKGDAEVMTRHGWVKFDDYNGEEILIGDGEKSWFEKPREVVHYDNDEDLVEYSKKKGYYHLSTKGHRMVYKHNGEIRIREAWQGLPADGRVNELVVTTKLYGEGIKLSDDMLRLAVAIQADGYYEKDCGGISFQFAKLRKIERLENILGNLGLKYSKRRINNGKNEGQYKIRILAGHGVPNYKNLPFEWIYQSNKHQKELLIEEIKKWDGHESLSGFSEYYTVNEYQATWVNTLARMSGIISSLTKREVNREGSRDIYRVTFPGKRDVMTTQKLKRVEVPYSGKVHCVSVSSTMFWTRMNGCISLTGNTHPDLFPTMERDNLGTSMITTYKDIKGVRRNNIYELVSANANSIRSDSVHLVIYDELAFYRNPYQLEAAIAPAIPETGFSLVIYVSTFEDKNDFFKDKIITARDNPEDWTLIFAPWFMTYPEHLYGVDYHQIELSEYATDVMLPAMRDFGIPPEQWGDKIVWYNKKLTELGKTTTFKEYPTTIDEVLNYGEDRCVFQKEFLDAQEGNIEAGTPYRILTDNSTGKVEAQETDVSPFTIFRPPVYGHRYRVVIDPITARSDDTDYFVMHVMDLSNNEQVAIFREKGLQDEDYADWAVSIGTIYNKAQLCPEINVANGFVVAVNSRRYYNWYYQDKKSRADRTPGLRTTVSTKERYIDALNTMLSRGSIIIHDRATLDELRTYIKKVKTRSDGSKSIKMEAKKGKHDDTVAALFIYAGSLSLPELEGRKKSGWSVL